MNEEGHMVVTTVTVKPIFFIFFYYRECLGSCFLIEMMSYYFTNFTAGPAKLSPQSGTSYKSFGSFVTYTSINVLQLFWNLSPDANWTPAFVPFMMCSHRPTPTSCLSGRPPTTANFDPTDVAPNDRPSNRDCTRRNFRFPALSYATRTPKEYSWFRPSFFPTGFFSRRVHHTLASGGSYDTYGFPLAMILLSPPMGWDSLLLLKLEFQLLLLFHQFHNSEFRMKIIVEIS